jgi:hypothetical protein
MNYMLKLKKNEKGNKALPCYYVGLTGITPEERFKNHKSGIKSSRIVKKYGMHLVPELYETYNPMTYDLASAMEIMLAEMLRGKGHGIW